jgi:hypothetical protein
MHCSLWMFRGNPEQLAAGYEALLEAIPSSNMRLHVAARLPDGLLMLDTCPSREDFEAFIGSEQVQELLAANGLGEPESVVDAPVLGAFVDGERRA